MRPVHDSLLYSNDFYLAQLCLERNEAALRRLQELHAKKVTSFLVGVGAAPSEAHEMTDSLWGHCLTLGVDGRPRLARYSGMCALDTWLKTVALNRLISAKRRAASWQKFAPVRLSAFAETEDEDESAPAWMADGPTGENAEAPLHDLMRAAIEAAFLACPAEDFVLLQLAHADNLRVVDLAKMFACGTATISRDLDAAGAGIREATRAYVKASDPWLDLKWEDFLDLCRTATPACFGVE